MARVAGCPAREFRGGGDRPYDDEALVTRVMPTRTKAAMVSATSDGGPGTEAAVTDTVAMEPRMSVPPRHPESVTESQNSKLKKVESNFERSSEDGKAVLENAV